MKISNKLNIFYLQINGSLPSEYKFEYNCIYSKQVKVFLVIYVNSIFTTIILSILHNYNFITTFLKNLLNLQKQSNSVCLL